MIQLCIQNIYLINDLSKVLWGNCSMKIVSINAVSYGSTGNIMRGITHAAEEGIAAKCYTFYGNWKYCPKEFMGSHRFGYRFENTLCLIFSRVTGLYYIGHIFGTASLLHKINKIKPDIIHLHNLHMGLVNVPMLFHYIKKNNIPIVWTFHDCWPMTGHCPHFTMAKCEKWREGCHNCPIPREYPASYIDQSKTLWKWKKKWFTGVKTLTIVTPCEWLANIVKQSFLKEYPVRVIHNGIDLEIFRPTENDIRHKFHIAENQFLILGVALGWLKEKGLDVFIELTKRLDPDKYKIILVGTNDATDKLLPNNIISIHRTQNQRELAEIYTAADLFVNTTREDTFPTVNLEALACGTPVITFDTGGSPECVDERCGSVTPVDDLDALVREIVQTCESKCFSHEACVKRAAQFEQNARFKEYVSLYEDILCHEEK